MYDEVALLGAPLSAPPANAVTVVVAVDENYVAHLAALIESIKASISDVRFLDFVVLDGGVQKSNKILLEKQFFKDFAQGRISFINCEHLYAGIETHAYFSAATFYRISIARILQNHDKVLYLDTDVVVLKDISCLYDIELDGQYIAAAVQDLCTKANIKLGKKKRIPKRYSGFGGIVISEYVRDFLELGDRADQYFQAGVMLFDLNGFRESNIEDIAIKDLSSRKYWLLDQDVLNRCLLGRTKSLDVCWNLMAGFDSFSENVPSEWVQKVKDAFEDPGVIHYAGFDEKPWNNPTAKFSNFYWFFLRRTFWYEDIVRSVGRFNKKKSIFPFFK